jgi:hypothetical protein
VRFCSQKEKMFGNSKIEKHVVGQYSDRNLMPLKILRSTDVGQ